MTKTTLNILNNVRDNTPSSKTFGDNWRHSFNVFPQPKFKETCTIEYSVATENVFYILIKIIAKLAAVFKSHCRYLLLYAPVIYSEREASTVHICKSVVKHLAQALCKPEDRLHFNRPLLYSLRDRNILI
jgi:hypothetical protein